MIFETINIRLKNQLVNKRNDWERQFFPFHLAFTESKRIFSRRVHNFVARWRALSPTIAIQHSSTYPVHIVWSSKQKNRGLTKNFFQAIFIHWLLIFMFISTYVNVYYVNDDYVITSFLLFQYRTLPELVRK